MYYTIISSMIIKWQKAFVFQTFKAGSIPHMTSKTIYRRSVLTKMYMTNSNTTNYTVGMCGNRRLVNLVIHAVWYESVDQPFALKKSIDSSRKQGRIRWNIYVTTSSFAISRHCSTQLTVISQTLKVQIYSRGVLKNFLTLRRWVTASKVSRYHL